VPGWHRAALLVFYGANSVLIVVPALPHVARPVNIRIIASPKPFWPPNTDVYGRQNTRTAIAVITGETRDAGPFRRAVASLKLL
jgi:hypothetical protein